MKWTLFTILFVLSITATIALSCQKRFSCEGCSTSNQLPIAVAGPDQLITLPIDSVLLDGTASNDPDGNITRLQWTKISGPASFSITRVDSAKTVVRSLVQGSYQFLLKVTDDKGASSQDTVQIKVNPSGTTNNPPVDPLVDIYVAGDQNGEATYWKNGQPVKLRSGSTNSGSSSIAVVGIDVYVAGWEGDAFMYGNNRAKYWKNGQEVFLTGTTGAGATSIAVVGGDIYVAGWEFEGPRTVARYWKNNKPVTLTDGLKNAEATCIVVVGGSVYISGHENGVAKYWKNSQPVNLTNGSKQAYANSIAVVGSDVYVAGSESNGNAHVAKYWKNGQAVTLTNGSAVHATANSIAVVGTDVYVAGWEGDFVGRVGGLGSVAKYWKNGQMVALTNGASYAYPSSIAFFGNDVYVGGTEFNIRSLPVVAKYWKNGPTVPITVSNDASASSILVVPR